MAAIDTPRIAYGATGFVSRISAVFSAISGSIASWNDARLTRNALVSLTERELDDIGLVRGDIDMIARGAHRF